MEGVLFEIKTSGSLGREYNILTTFGT